jgi:hypothetical protein
LAPELLCRIGNYPFFNCDENAFPGTPGTQYCWRFQWLGRVSTTAYEPNRAPSDIISKCRNSCSDVRRNAMHVAFRLRSHRGELISVEFDFRNKSAKENEVDVAVTEDPAGDVNVANHAGVSRMLGSCCLRFARAPSDKEQQ